MARKSTGVAQAFALIPGISRSGATVVAAMWLGVEAREAAAFSFLMAVPAIGGAALLLILDLDASAATLTPAVLLGGSGSLSHLRLAGVLAAATFMLASLPSLASTVTLRPAR